MVENLKDQTIFDTVKQYNNISTDDLSFDLELTVVIASCFANLESIGVELPTDISPNTTWAVLDDQSGHTDLLMQYFALNSKLLFDPPTGQPLTNLKEMVKETYWRLQMEFDISIDSEGGE